MQTTFLSGNDSIAISTQDAQRLYIVVHPQPSQSTKQVAIFDIDQPQQQIALRDLKENTGIGMAFNSKTGHMMLSFDDSYRVGLMSPGGQLVDNYRHPVQIAPGSITTSPDGKRVYVMNYTSNTITSIPADVFEPQKQIPLQPLIDYRAGVLNAFADLLGGLLQYLKDCFCDHLLINCPKCDGTEKLYLACITIKGGKVFKVCNFSMRKYVHSFPTVEYWLSIVPIIPAVKMAFEKFCCSALPGLFAKYNAPRPDPTTALSPGASNRLKSNQMRSGITFAQQADFRSAVSKMVKTSAPGRTLTMDALTGSVRRTFTPASDTVIHRGDIEDKSPDDARKKLEENRIVVDKVEAYDPGKAGRNLIRYTQAPTNLKPGTRVNLVTKDDKVMFYTLAEEEPPKIAELRTEFESTRVVATETKVALDRALPALEGLRSEVAASKTTFEENRAALQKISPQVEELRKRLEADASTIENHKKVIATTLPRLETLNKDFESSRAELAANKATLEKLSPQLEDLRSKVAADSLVLAENRARIEKALPRLDILAATVDKSSPEIADLRTQLAVARAGLEENKTAVAEALTLRQEVVTLRQELVQTRQTHQQELIARDRDINELKANLARSGRLLDTINERVKKLPPA
jgi:predicted  nucleic acid-binding Zn-ribbon protein